MKRWIALLALALLLTGCAAPEDTLPTGTTASTAAPTTTPPTQPDIPEDPIPDVETAWQEDLDGNYQAIAPMGDELLLFGDGTLAKYSDGAVSVMLNAPIPLPDSSEIRILDSGIVYYDSTDNALVTLDAALAETDRVPLEEEVIGAPFVAADGKTLYYCTASGIRIWDTETCISRYLKIHAGNWLGIFGDLFDGAYLICQLQQEDTVRSLLISTATGETVYEGDVLTCLTSSDTLFSCITRDEWIFGHRDQQPQNLLVTDAIPLPRQQLALAITAAENGLQLELYDLNTGAHIASECYPGAESMTSPVFWQGNLVFLSGSRLCFWDYSLSPSLYPVEDDTVYTAYRYTADDPDTEGLAALRERADALEQQYGVDILLWNDVTDVQPEGYVFEVEHRTQIYEAGLTALETVLARFPDGFLKTAASWTDDGTVHIVLARSVSTPADACGAQYLLGWNTYIPLAMDDSLEQTFCHGLGHIVDTRVLSHSDGFYEWHTVNPSGFAYDNDYASWQGRESKYLEGSSRYFVNSLSMTFPVEDRATLLEYAMLPGNEEVFESKYMQAKLKRLKTGLREAFALDGETYPWEQYLD